MLIDVSMKSLKSRLAQDEHLVQVATALWGVDQAKQDRAATLALLTERMQDSFWAREVWEQLGGDEQICLFQALTADDRGKGAPCERVRKRTKLSAPLFEAAITCLLEFGLLEEGEVLQKPSVRRAEVFQPLRERAVFSYRECAQSLYQRGQERFTAFLDRSTMSLERLVGARSWEQLQDLARLCHVPARQAQQIRLELQRSVAEALTQPLVVFDLLHRVDMQAQQVFLWLCGNGGRVNMQEVLAFVEGDKERLRALLRQLETHALAFDTLTHSGERVVFIQEALYAAAKGEAGQYADDERTYVFSPASSPPAVIREAQPHLCYDLAVVVGSVCQTRIEPTQSDSIPRRLVAKLRPLLHGLPRIGEAQADLYVDILFRVAISLELLHSAIPYGEEKPRYQLGPKLPQWSQLSTVEQLRHFLAWWPQSTTWYDVRPGGRLIYPSSYSTHAARRTLLTQLQRCVPGQWYRVDALQYAIWRQQPVIPYEESFAQRTTARRTSLRGRREQWMQGEGPLYMALLFSTLHEAGVITLGYTRTQEVEGEEHAPPKLFQVTALGAVVLAESGKNGEKEQTSAADQKVLIVQPNYDVILRETHRWDVLYRLLCFAQVVHIGPVATFKLTQSALLRGLEAGLPVDDILAVLAQHCQQPLPQNVEYTLKWDWPRGYHVAGLTEVVLVELSDEESRRALQGALAPLGCDVREVAPRLFAITPNDRSFLEIKRALEKANLVVKGQPTLSQHRW